MSGHKPVGVTRNGNGDARCGRRQGTRCGDGNRCAAAAFWRPLADGRGDPPAACQYAHLAREPAARRGDLGGDRRGGARGGAGGQRPPRAHHPVRRRHLAGRPRQRAVRRTFARLLAHEPDPGRQRARPRLRGAARRLAQAAQRLPARPRPVLPGRPGRRGGDHRRHGRHTRRAPRRCATAPCARTCSTSPP